MRRWYIFSLITVATATPSALNAQRQDTLPKEYTLADCISYALKYQPLVQQAAIDEEITAASVKIQLSAAYPQLGLNYNLQHYLKAPHITSPQVARNSSTTNVSISQNVLSRDIMLARRTGGLVRESARKNTSLAGIQLVADVSRAFYDLLVTVQQSRIINEDIRRLQKNVSDTRFQYEAGTVDKTDYTRAVIALNNSIAVKKQLDQALKTKNAILRQQMGNTDTSMLTLKYDNRQLEADVMDAPRDPLSYDKRVEFQQLKIRKQILDYKLKYTRWAYLPSVSLFGSYNLIAQNRDFSKVYRRWYPNSLAGITFTLPIYQAGSRIRQNRIARLDLARLQQDFRNIELAINTEYTTALAEYNSNLANYIISKENEQLAGVVYSTIELQYRSGIKTFLELITAETDLRTAEVNTLNALYLALSSRVSVQQAAGTITY